jgi:hypothetical protein
LTWKCASRHNGAHFFIVSTSKSAPGMVCFVHFDFEMCYFVNHLLYYSSGWWFQTFLFSIYIYIWDNLSRWLIFFRGVETTNQVVFIMTSPFVGWKSSWLLEDDEATPHPNAVGVPRGWRGGRFGRLQWGNDNDDGYCQRIFFSDGYDKVMLVKYFDMTVIFSMIILMVPSLAIFQYELIRTLVWSHCCNDGRPLEFNNDWCFLGYSTLSTGFTGWTYRNKAVKSKWGEPNMNARFISSQWWIYIALYGVNIRWGDGDGFI